MSDTIRFVRREKALQATLKALIYYCRLEEVPLRAEELNVLYKALADHNYQEAMDAMIEIQHEYNGPGDGFILAEFFIHLCEDAL